MGSIDTDPASSPAANLVVQAKVFYTRDDDGLSKEWHGNVWLNPPYATRTVALFVAKLREEFLAGRTKQAIGSGLKRVERLQISFGELFQVEWG